MQLEVVNAFPDREALKAFKQWVMTPDAELLAAAQKVGKKGSGKAKLGSEEGMHFIHVASSAIQSCAAEDHEFTLLRMEPESGSTITLPIRHFKVHHSE